MTANVNVTPRKPVPKGMENVDSLAFIHDEYMELPELSDEMMLQGNWFLKGKQVSVEEANKTFQLAFARGRPKATLTKKLTSIRLSTETLEFFKAEGKGWQTRMDAALKDWIALKQAQKS